MYFLDRECQRRWPYGADALNGLRIACDMQQRIKAQIRNQYNQVPHLTQDTIWENEQQHKKTSHIREPRGQPFHSG